MKKDRLCKCGSGIIQHDQTKDRQECRKDASATRHPYKTLRGLTQFEIQAIHVLRNSKRSVVVWDRRPVCCEPPTYSLRMSDYQTYASRVLMPSEALHKRGLSPARQRKKYPLPDGPCPSWISARRPVSLPGAHHGSP